MSEPTQVEARPGDEGGTATVPTVKVHHEATNADAEIPAKTLPMWQEYGWTEVGEVSAEQPVTGTEEISEQQQDEE